MINILISVNRNYLDKAETMLHSFRRNNSEEVTVYLMNHCLSDTEIKKFKKYLHRYLRMDLEVIDVSKTVFDQMPLSYGRFSIEIYYRVLAQFLLPQTVDRIMWLDADIVICGSICEFYHQEFEGKLLVACPDAACEDEEIVQIKDNLGLPKGHLYFNSGVLLLNLEALRNKTNIYEIAQIAQSIADYFIYPDQDLLNFLYSGRVKYCDQNRFNCQAKRFGKLTKDQVEDIVILHYTGYQKPWLFYYIYELSKAAIPYLKEIALQGKWFSIIKVAILYAFWLIYYKTGICNVVRKKILPDREQSSVRYDNRR
ncbi:MAG: glycosyltransferase family 8 protein [Oliverpabstia sp.]